jgi:hypothetical protein
VGAFVVLFFISFHELSKLPKTDGSIKAWGEPGDGGTNAPDGKGYTKIYSNTYAFAKS